MDEMRSFADLLDLQDLDLQIDRLLHERESLPELAAYREANVVVLDLTGQNNDAEAALKDTSLGLDKTNGELELAQLKLSREQNRLYAGGMSARDADYVRREVEMLRRQQSDMEDEIIELMERSEEQEASVLDLTERLEKATEDMTELESRIAKEWKAIDSRLAVKETRKRDVVPLISEDLFELYEELRISKMGVAVGRLVDGVCGGCHLAITPAEQLEVDRDDPPRCTHCRRILAR